MIRIVTIRILKTNVCLKIISLVFGYLTWSYISHYCSVHITLSIPLAFYNVPPNISLEAPETITVTLSGKRQFLNRLSFKSLSAHLDGHNFKEGTLPLSITSDILFLPPCVSLIHYNPSPLVIKADYNSSSEEKSSQ